MEDPIRDELIELEKQVLEFANKIADIRRKVNRRIGAFKAHSTRRKLASVGEDD